MKFREYINEAMGYKLKAGDKKIIKAFITGAKDGKGTNLWIEGDYLFGPMQYSTTDFIAARKGGQIVVGRAYGNVTQTYINFINKNK